MQPVDILHREAVLRSEAALHREAVLRSEAALHREAVLRGAAALITPRISPKQKPKRNQQSLQSKQT
jgi:hypothetical protein